MQLALCKKNCISRIQKFAIYGYFSTPGSITVVYSMHTLVAQTGILAKKRGGNNWLPRKKRGGNNWLNGVSLVHSPLENFYGTY